MISLHYKLLSNAIGVEEADRLCEKMEQKGNTRYRIMIPVSRHAVKAEKFYAFVGNEWTANKLIDCFGGERIKFKKYKCDNQIVKMLNQCIEVLKSGRVQPNEVEKVYKVLSHRAELKQ